jgi:hypothetical protein
MSCVASSGSSVACDEKWVREDAITPPARALRVELERLKPADFARRIDMLTSHPVADSQSAIESIDAASRG